MDPVLVTVSLQHQNSFKLLSFRIDTNQSIDWQFLKRGLQIGEDLLLRGFNITGLFVKKFASLVLNKYCD